SYAKIGELLDGERTSGGLASLSVNLLDREQARLVGWLDRHGRDEPYLLIRESLYKRMEPALLGRAAVLHREQGLDRMNLVLLRARDDGPRLGGPASEVRTPR